MDPQRAVAFILIASFAIMAFSFAISVPGLYQTQDIEARLQIIQTYRTRWLAGQVIVFVFGVLTSVAYTLLAYTLRSQGQAGIPVFGAVAMVAGSISGLYFVYLQTIDPRGGYSGVYPTPENLAYWLWLAAMILFGISFLRAAQPAWLGYLTAGAAAAYGLLFLITGLGFMAPFVLVILNLVIGIVLLRT